MTTGWLPSRPNRLGAMASFADFLAVVSAVGGAAAGVMLLVHRDPQCGGALVCSTRHHPFVIAGIAVLIGGLLLAAMCLIVGRLCLAVADLHQRPADRVGPAYPSTPPPDSIPPGATAPARSRPASGRATTRLHR